MSSFIFSILTAPFRHVAVPLMKAHISHVVLPTAQMHLKGLKFAFISAGLLLNSFAKDQGSRKFDVQEEMARGQLLVSVHADGSWCFCPECYPVGCKTTSVETARCQDMDVHYLNLLAGNDAIFGGGLWNSDRTQPHMKFAEENILDREKKTSSIDKSASVVKTSIKTSSRPLSGYKNDTRLPRQRTSHAMLSEDERTLIQKQSQTQVKQKTIEQIHLTLQKTPTPLTVQKTVPTNNENNGKEKSRMKLLPRPVGQYMTQLKELEWEKRGMLRPIMEEEQLIHFRGNPLRQTHNPDGIIKLLI